MRRWVLVASVLVIAAPAAGQSRARWRLHFEMDKPSTHVVTNLQGQPERIWYLTYRVSNRTDQGPNPTNLIIPLNLQIFLYVETGEDLLDDVRRVEIDRVRQFLDDPTRAEELLFGTYYRDTPLHEYEFDLLRHVLRLWPYSEGVARETMDDFKAGGRMLNAGELRAKRFINPGETYEGIAMFRGVDPRAQVVEVHLHGLVDSLVMTFRDEVTPSYRYENLVWKVRYRFPGDEFERDRDVLTEARRWWSGHQRPGPPAHKETLDRLVLTLADDLRNAERRARGEEAPVPILAQADLGAIARVLKFSVSVDFGIDGSQTLEANGPAIWRMYEWWLAHQSRLVYERQVNRFVLSDLELPGTTGERRR